MRALPSTSLKATPVRTATHPQTCRYGGCGRACWAACHWRPRDRSLRVAIIIRASPRPAPSTLMLENSARRRHILKCSVAAIAEQPTRRTVDMPPECSKTYLFPSTLQNTSCSGDHRTWLPSDEEVEQAVAIVIRTRARKCWKHCALPSPAFCVTSTTCPCPCCETSGSDPPR